MALGDRVVELFGAAEHDVLLVAPFVKHQAFDRLVSAVAATIPVTCVTRWDPFEIAQGVSDLEVFDILSKRTSSKLLLVANLHAKYFRADSRCLVGSANVTGAALGWSKFPNVELLVEAARQVRFESTLIQHGVLVTPELAREMRRHVEAAREHLPPGTQNWTLELEQVGTVDGGRASLEGPWVPSARDPSDLYRAYRGQLESLTRDSLAAVSTDLVALAPPSGLSERAFPVWIAGKLATERVIRDIDAFLSEPRRFGEVRSHLRKVLADFQVDRDATEAWQTLMRWMTYFLPDTYEVTQPNYTEVMRKRATPTRLVQPEE